MRISDEVVRTMSMGRVFKDNVHIHLCSVILIYLIDRPN